MVGYTRLTKIQLYSYQRQTRLDVSVVRKRETYADRVIIFLLGHIRAPVLSGPAVLLLNGRLQLINYYRCASTVSRDGTTCIINIFISNLYYVIQLLYIKVVQFEYLFFPPFKTVIF